MTASEGLRLRHRLGIGANLDLRGQYGAPVVPARDRVGDSPSRRGSRGQERQIESYRALSRGYRGLAGRRPAGAVVEAFGSSVLDRRNRVSTAWAVLPAE